MFYIHFSRKKSDCKSKELPLISKALLRFFVQKL
ncbi:hypothetical protein HNQ92_000470 [Rhabdobacter roseus]|uniref:Uncharacterized protein n=1 Tax=Rhabdobacter roseus TaxID=1655419 RepID=A0A840TRI9_9BACT|nr:hypothetical protein [Rhabdobacter roseus]